ncbi:MAG: glutaredoxin [Anaerolineae bacterium]|nr:glutaredoxin [Anaerolineae bacterium]
MDTELELVMITRTRGCPFMSLARHVLDSEAIRYRELNIDNDPQARANLLEWVGFLSIPTLFVAAPGSDAPNARPEPLPAGASPRGIDRGTMITEPKAGELKRWLRKHGLMEPDDGEDDGF